MSLLLARHEFEQLVIELKKHVFTLDYSDVLTKTKTVFLMAPTSFIGQSFAQPIAKKLLDMGKHVFLVDDTLSKTVDSIYDCSVIGTAALAQLKNNHCLAINMANTVFAHGFFETTALRIGIPIVDIISVLDLFDLPVIYQSASVMRAATLARMDDYVALAHQLDDELSVKTLGCYLKMRVTLNRKAILPVLCSLEDEYFSPYPAGKNISFELGSNEILCDVGAHVGTTIYKFLTATQWKYSAIYAFEPDTVNFKALQNGIFESLPNFYPKNIALSDVKSVLSFSETGTMGSRLDFSGNTQIQASTLDDEVEHTTFIKMDVEGHEVNILQGAKRLLAESKPKLAITGYHFSDDLLDIVKLIKEVVPEYRLRLRHHSFYYYDTIIYADISE